MVSDSDLEFDSDLIFRYRGELFTGVSYEQRPNLGRSEIAYRNGMQEGYARDWYPSNMLKSESFYMQGTLHGTSREFDPDGRLLTEIEYEYGIVVVAREYDSDGRVVAVEEIDPSDYNFGLLERFRSQYRWS